MRKLFRFTKFHDDEFTDKFGLLLDWGTLEDYYYSGTTGEPPQESMEKLNEIRHKWAYFSIKINGHYFQIEIRLKHVGHIKYGKDMLAQRERTKAFWKRMREKRSGQ